MTLAAHHYAMLHTASAITDVVIKARGYVSLDHPDEVQDLGFKKAQARTAPVLAIPLWDVHGQQTSWQIRPDSPRQMKDGTICKYETKQGGRLQLDVHPSVQSLLGDPHVPLWITEGVRKGDALVSQGACVIALMGGVWGFRGTNEHGGKVILPDWEHVALNGRLVYVAYDSDLASKKGVQEALKGLWTFLRSRQALPARVEWPEDYQQKKWGVDDFLADNKTIDDLLAMIPPLRPLPPTAPYQRNGTTPAPRIDPDKLLTDTFNATALVRDHGQDLRYCEAWKSWLVWTGSHWERDTTGAVMQRAKQTIRHLAGQADSLADDGAVRALLEHVRKSLSTASLRAMIDNARSEPGISVRPDVFDVQPWLLNVSNGTLDLQTGTRRDHARADMLTQCLPIPYDPLAQCSAWKAFLWRAMAERQELIDFLQRAVGYALSGSTREQVVFILYGPTKTGKSTFLSTLRALLGPYAQQVDMRTFMFKEREEVRNDLADLAASRLVCAVESQKARRLDEALIKQITGGVDVLKARFLYQEHFIFKPQFKLFLGTNYKPEVDGNDQAIWERIRLVPFEVQIPKEERNKQLETQLLDELPGILAWAVRGCLQWQKLNELREPDAVTKATQNYRDEMDVVELFLQECCRFDARFQVQAAALHSAFTTWCEGTGKRSLTRKDFTRALENKGYKKHASNYVWWLGVALNPEKV